MSDVKPHTIRIEQEDTVKSDANGGFGSDHQDITDDLAALRSVMAIPAFSSGLKQLKNSFSQLKSLLVG